VPGYLPPECIKSKDSQNSTAAEKDIFACGVVLFEMLTGNRPFEMADINTNPLYRLISGNQHSKFWKKHKDSLSTPDMPFEFSQEFQNLINSMLSFDKTRRPSLAEILTSQWMTGPIPTHSDLLKLFTKRETQLQTIKRAQKATSKSYRKSTPTNPNPNPFPRNYGFDPITPKCRGSPCKEAANLQEWSSKITAANLTPLTLPYLNKVFPMNHNSCIIDSDISGFLQKIVWICSKHSASISNIDFDKLKVVIKANFSRESVGNYVELEVRLYGYGDGLGVAEIIKRKGCSVGFYGLSRKVREGLCSE
jgi:serine/threonine protein kinase